MTFRDVPTKVDFAAQEQAVLRFWKESRAFEALRQLHAQDRHWSFIDGPITANNPMGVHHGWGRAYKDLMQRFWTMRGRKLRYQNGFDCQGLHVEVEVEKELGFQTKKDLEDFGLEMFVRRCKARVLRYAAQQTEQSVRLGYWMDWNDPDLLRDLGQRLLEDPKQVVTVDGPDGPVTDTVEMIVGRLGLPELGGSYFTFSNENNYMIWSFLKKCWEKGWIYHGVDVMPWCPRCATALSQNEIVTDGYRELTHRSVSVRFPLLDRAGESLLVWTTTPWTLTSNVAAAVGPDLIYARVRQGDEVLYLSKGTLHMLQGKYEVLGELQGREMDGWRYQGPFDELPAVQRPGGLTPLKGSAEPSGPAAVEAHRVILWDEVGEAEGTGIVHIAPGCGAEDFQLGREYGLPMIAPLQSEGYFVDGFDWLTGMQVAQVAEPIFDDLQRKGVLYRVAEYTHRYPTCWRCKTELVFRLVDEWFIHMGEKLPQPRQELTAEQKAANLRYQIMDVVDQIEWMPDYGYERELDWLRNMSDWMISKKRYWGLALPIWTCEACGAFTVVGSQAELKERAVAGWEEFEGHTPHRPYVDAVKLRCDACGATMERIPDVGNPWLDAGIVPYSTLRYRSDREYWESWFPAHWITESFPGQFRNWFYSLLAMSTVLENRPPFLRVLGYNTLLAEDGREMHKSLGNAIEFNSAADKMGVDVMRWLFFSHRPENDLLFGYNRGDEARRRFLIPLWNVYSFFVTYANLDGWRPNQAKFTPGNPEGERPASGNLLDRWVLARLYVVTESVTQALDASDMLAATQELEAYLNDLTDWYVRRSRRRFWKSAPADGMDVDKQSAYETLYFVLVRLARLLAPFTPFVAEVMYGNLVGEQVEGAYGSVHHTAWPVERPNPGEASFAAPAPPLKGEREGRAEILEAMALAREIAGLGLSARSAAGIKVRQPLPRVLVYVAHGHTALPPELVEIVMDELNVKALEFAQAAGELVTYRLLPDNKRLGPRFGAQFPQVRQALAAVDPAEVAAKVQVGQPVQLAIDGQLVELAPEEILVNSQPVAGLAVVPGERATVAIDTTITPALRAEGLARELVRRIQTMRKEAGYNIEDRITVYYQSDGELASVLVQWAGYIQHETLATQLLPETPPAAAFTQEQEVEGMGVVLGVVKNSSNS